MISDKDVPMESSQHPVSASFFLQEEFLTNKNTQTRTHTPLPTFCIRVFSSVSYRNPEGKPPRFPQKPTISQKGDVLSMECILEAMPVADITWYHGQDRIEDGERFKILRKAISIDTYLLTLQISLPTANDGGIYRCHAFNPFGESNAHITLNFKGISTFLVFLYLPSKQNKPKTPCCVHWLFLLCLCFFVSVLPLYLISLHYFCCLVPPVLYFVSLTRVSWCCVL